MDLKNGVAVCLISLFSATLVLLIARALDIQAASRLEPQLARIVDELEAIRKSGRFPAVAGGEIEAELADDCLMVYYFHGNTRCPTCRSIESQSYETVQSDFASQLENGELAWKILNYEEPTGKELGQRFEIMMPMVVLARMNGGQIGDWKSLDEVWALVGDKLAFADYVRNEISQMLDSENEQPAGAKDSEVLEIPLPTADQGDVPLLSAPAEIPLPQ